ncbi:MAG: PhoH family protein [Phycisphaerae bacterium]
METTIPIEDPSRRGALYGPADRNLRLIRAAFDVQITARDNTVYLRGDDASVTKAARVITDLQRSLRVRPDVTDELVRNAIGQAESDGASGGGPAIEVYQTGARIVPRGPGQRRYVDSIAKHDLTFCVGPAGTGKTYLAVAVAVSLLKQHKIKRIVLVRPAVEAGEKLGYLPGDLVAKVNPYLRPLFDAMHDTMTFDQIKRFMQNDVVEVVPLAFMRGRTLNHAAVILDEAQNSTIPQMLMFLTRLGHGSKMIVTGDDSQSDLDDAMSGLGDAIARIGTIPGVSVVRLSGSDIVRHPLVQSIVGAYGDRSASSAG